MDYAWFVILKGKEKGPFTFQELLGMKEITPDTLAWREGMEKWTPIRNIPELKKLFEDKDSSTPSVKEVFDSESGSDDLALSFPQADPPLFYWLLFAAILIIYALLQLYS